ncbi:MAG: hypothetical protein KC643_04235 [Nitrospira sp.]|nr:hypothetical protein [Nitrospira sp.]
MYEVGNILGLKQPRLGSELMNALLAYELEESPLRNAYAPELLSMLHTGVRFVNGVHKSVTQKEVAT